MRLNSWKSKSLLGVSASLAFVGLLLGLAAFTKKSNGFTLRPLLPRGPAAAAAEATPASTPVSTHWTIKHFGQCCEGNLAAQGNSTYVLLPILVTGNQIWRSDDNGINWTEKYPPTNASVPYGIEGDLQALGDDIDFFGTLVAQGVSAHSTDRGETWTVNPIAVTFPANDQAWSYMGPFAGMRPGGPLPTDRPYVLTGWYRIGSVALFSFDGGITWPLQTPLPGDDGSGAAHVVCEETATPATTPGADTRISDVNFVNHKSGHHGAWGTDKQFYWTQTGNGAVGTPGNFYVCKTNNFGVTWSGTIHPIADGDTSTTVTFSGFDNKGTFYVLIGQTLYVSFDQGQSFAYTHQLPVNPNGGAGDPGANEFFVVNCGTIHIGVDEAGSGVNNIWYLRGSNVDTANPTWDQELVDVITLNSNFRLDFMQVVLNGNNIPTISYTDTGGGVVTASRDAALAPNDSCSATIIDRFVSAVSRKTHGSAGVFDVPLPLTGQPGIECRTGSQPGNHDVVVSFTAPATVTAATCDGMNASTSASGNDITVHCTGVQNAKVINVALTGVTVGSISGNITVPMGVLAGDTNADGFVNSADIGQTKAQSGASVTNLNFREDVNTDGFLNSADIGLVKSKSGTALR